MVRAFTGEMRMHPTATKRSFLSWLGLGALWIFGYVLFSEGLDRTFDFVLYPVAMNRFGFIHGTGIMMLASGALCAMMLAMYQFMKVDLFAIETSKEALHALSRVRMDDVFDGLVKRPWLTPLWLLTPVIWLLLPLARLWARFIWRCLTSASRIAALISFLYLCTFTDPFRTVAWLRGKGSAYRMTWSDTHIFAVAVFISNVAWALIVVSALFLWPYLVEWTQPFRDFLAPYFAWAPPFYDGYLRGPIDAIANFFGSIGNAVESVWKRLFAF